MAQVGSKYQDWRRLKSVGSAISDITKTSSIFAHVEDNRIFHFFQKRFSIFHFKIFFFEFFLWRISTCLKMISSLLELSRNCGMSNMNLYVHICNWAFFYCMKFCTITKFKKYCSKPNFSKREKSKIYIYKIYKIWKFLSIVQASSKKYVRMFRKILCIFVMSQI